MTFRTSIARSALLAVVLGAAVAATGCATKKASSKPESSGSGTAKSDAAKSEPAKSEPAKSDAAKSDPAKSSGDAKPAPTDPGHFGVLEYDGRYYVFGDAKTEAAFMKSPHMQMSKSFIGAGPQGRTVVFEVKDKLPGMTERIIDRFSTTYGVYLK